MERYVTASHSCSAMVEPEGQAASKAVKRLNWGCGSCVASGWINSDRMAAEGIDLPCDIREGLPLEGGSVDYIAAIHVLQDLCYGDVLPALRELRRVLKS